MPPPSTSRVCYCTNVHPGRTPDEILAQLDANDPRPHREFKDPVYRIGLWLSESVTRTFNEDRSALERFADELFRREIRVVTLNGFPQRDFHQPSVKREVYQPNWTALERVEHTVRLYSALSQLVPKDVPASISTLPLGWRADDPNLDSATNAIGAVIGLLRYMALQVGGFVTLDLEPEPGCVLDRAEHVIRLFERLRERMEPEALAHLGVCHDICHSAVMFEDQTKVLRAYADAGIPVNKIQVSSAIRTPMTPEALAALAAFDEPRYLHQTSVRGPNGDRFYEDLPDALAACDPDEHAEARVHFHVPLFAESLGPLGTTQADIAEAVRTARELFPKAVFELETYAWSVLPTHLQPESLAHGIAAELDWFDRTFPELRA